VDRLFDQKLSLMLIDGKTCYPSVKNLGIAKLRDVLSFNLPANIVSLC